MGWLLKILSSLFSILVWLIISSTIGEIKGMEWVGPIVSISLWIILIIGAHIVDTLEKIEKNTRKSKEVLEEIRDYVENIEHNSTMQ